MHAAVLLLSLVVSVVAVVWTKKKDETLQSERITFESYTRLYPTVGQLWRRVSDLAQIVNETDPILLDVEDDELRRRWYSSVSAIGPLRSALAETVFRLGSEYEALRALFPDASVHVDAISQAKDEVLRCLGELHDIAKLQPVDGEGQGSRGTNNELELARAESAAALQKLLVQASLLNKTLAAVALGNRRAIGMRTVN